MPGFPTCKVREHVKYKPYNTLESKQVPKSTVKITLPSMEMWRKGRVGQKTKKTNTKGKVKPKNDGIKKRKQKLHIRGVLYKWSTAKEVESCPVRLSVSSVSLDPEGEHKVSI